MRLGIGLGLTSRRGGGAAAFSPASLFAASEPGIWLDPSDLTTMFQDRAGTTPVTTPGQTVGLRLDKSGNGNHAVAPTDAARPTYGIEPKTGRRNLLTQSEGFDTASWTATGVTVSANAAIAPNGTLTAEKLVASGGTLSTRYIAQSVVGAVHTASAYFKAAELSTCTIFFTVHNANARFNLATGTVSLTAGDISSATITPVGDGWYRCTASTNTTTHNAVRFYAPEYGQSFTSDGTSGVFLWGAQLETGSSATAYQRVGTAFDVTEAGVPTCHYVQYDGTDDSMSTATIDFTGTDKMSVFAGVRKLSDAATGIFAELSATTSSNAGSFYLAAPNSTTQEFAFLSGGSRRQADTTAVLDNAAFVSPVSAVIAATGDISGSQTVIRGNGVTYATATGSQGTGNYGNYPLFIGRRNNASLPFNGRDYGIIVVGKTASGTEITATETYLASKTSEVTL